MRGSAERQAKMLMAVTTEDLVSPSHPIRRIRALTDGILAELSPELTKMYASGGRRSVPPEDLIKGTLLMAFYSIRSERQFCERLQHDMLFKWFRAPRGAMCPRGLRGPPLAAAAAGRS